MVARGVALVVAFGFLPPNFGSYLGPRNDTLPFYECRFSGGIPCHLSGCFWLSAPKFWWGQRPVTAILWLCDCMLIGGDTQGWCTCCNKKIEHFVLPDGGHAKISPSHARLTPGETFTNYFYRPQWSCGKVVFSQVSVSHSVHRGGGCLPQCMLGYTHPLGRYTLPPPGQVHPAWQVHPPGRYTPRQVQPRAGTPPGKPPPPPTVSVFSGWASVLECFLVCKKISLI